MTLNCVFLQISFRSFGNFPTIRIALANFINLRYKTKSSKFEARFVVYDKIKAIVQKNVLLLQSLSFSEISSFDLH